MVSLPPPSPYNQSHPLNPRHGWRITNPHIFTTFPTKIHNNFPCQIPPPPPKDSNFFALISAVVTAAGGALGRCSRACRTTSPTSVSLDFILPFCSRFLVLGDNLFILPHFLHISLSILCCHPPLIPAVMLSTSSPSIRSSRGGSNSRRRRRRILRSASC